MFVFRPVRAYNVPLDDRSLSSMSKKSFSDESLKKIRWVRHMYAEWRMLRNEDGNFGYISCDLEDVKTINVHDFVFGMCRFITEVKKMNGQNFPAKHCMI